MTTKDNKIKKVVRNYTPPTMLWDTELKRGVRIFVCSVRSAITSECDGLQVFSEKARKNLVLGVDREVEFSLSWAVTNKTC